MIIQSLQVLLPSYHSVHPLSVIPHSMRNPQYIPSSNIKKNGLPVLIGKVKEKKINTGSSIKDFEDDSGCAFEDDKSPLSYLKKRIYKRQRISSSIPGNGNSNFL